MNLRSAPSCVTFLPLSMRHAFSLIELLAAIAVVAVLAAILIPSLRSVHLSSLESKGVANMRQIGIAIDLFGQENNNKFPPGVAGTTDYATILTPYLGGKGSKWGEGVVRSPVFKDPLADDQEGNYHFSGNPNFLPDLQQPLPENPSASDLERMIARTTATRPGEQILLADGCVVPGWGHNSAATLYAVSGIWSPYPNDGSNKAVPRGPDKDGAGGNLRWRSANGQGVKCLFVDSHVAVMREGDLLQKHFQKDR